MGMVNVVVPLERLEEETVQWCKEMLALSPFALRLLKASFNAAEDGLAGSSSSRTTRTSCSMAARRRRRAATPTGRNASQTSPVSRSAHRPRELHSDDDLHPGISRRRHERGAYMGDGRPRAHAARGGGAGAGGHLAGARAQVISIRSRSWRRCWARCSSRWAPTSQTTTQTRGGAPTPRTGWDRCG